MAIGGSVGGLPAGDKAPGAFRTIGELSAELGVAQHILRYWETKFPQLRPLQRAGNRRYYRAEDVALTRQIHRLLYQEGYTVRGVQKLLADKRRDPLEAAPAPLPAVTDPEPTTPSSNPSGASSGINLSRLVDIRDRLVSALSD